MLRLVGIFAICLLSAINVYAGEVKVHFMDYNTLEWQALESTVKSTITTQLDDYCSSNDCKITGTNVNSTVVFTGAKGTFSIDGRFAIVDISATIGSTALTSEVLEQFMIARRADIVSGSKAVIAYVNDKLVYPARDNTDNYVIISVSSTVVLGLFILNLVLTKKSNEKEEKELIQTQEKKPLIRKPVKSDDENSKLEAVPETSESVPLTEASKLKSINTSQKSISRIESFDQKIDSRLHQGKYRKRNRSGSSHGSVIAGNVGSGIGSSRNLTEDEKWLNSNRISKSQSNDLLDNQRKSGQHGMQRSYTEHPFTQTNIPTIDKSLDNESSDPRVAARLASNDQL